ARRLGLNVVGIGLPGHFVVRYLPAKGDGRLLDPYDACQEVSLAEARKRVEAATGRAFQDEYLVPITKKAIVVRMLHNLMGIARAESDAKGMLRYLDTILAIRPESGQERLMRAAVRFQSGNRPGASADIQWLIDRKPSDVPLEKVEELERLLNGAER